MSDVLTSAGSGRPKLLFLRWTKPGQPPFLLQQLAEHVACLRQFFDVELVESDCDYDEVCDRVQPDLAVFESGIYAGPRSVVNVHTHPDVPKLGFLNADAFDPVRAAFVADMAAWGVEDFFTISVSMAEYTPEISDRLFCWPNFVDPTVHRDYGLQKTVPVLLTGSQARHYPWRNRVSRVLAQHYPTLAMPHFGWADSTAARRMTVGEGYARLVNSALVAPSCGSFTRDVVRKHLEIPASRTCLIAERTASLEAAGFEDMVNCVFADADDVVDKVDALLGDRDLLAEVTDAGHVLVHSQHTAAQRRQVRDWYDLWRESRSSGDIVQDGPFAPLTRAVADRPRPRVVVSGGEDRGLLRTGWDSLATGRYDAATRAFTRASNYHYLAEAEVGLCSVALATGHAAEAEETIGALLNHNVRHHRAIEPDPAQWALHVRALICLGRLTDARDEAGRYPGLRHDEMDRTRWAVDQLVDGETTPAHEIVGRGASRASVSPLPPATWSAWLEDLLACLVRNGQTVLAARLQSASRAPDPATVVRTPQPPARQQLDGALRRTSVSRRLRDAPASLAQRAAAQPRQLARRLVTRAWLDLVADVAEREPLESVVIVGHSSVSLRERSLRRALARNPMLPTVVELGGQATTTRLDDRATLVYVGRRASLDADWAPWLDAARIVVIDGAGQPSISRLLGSLLDGEFELVAQDGDYHVLRHHLGRQAWIRSADQPSSEAAQHDPRRTTMNGDGR